MNELSIISGNTWSHFLTHFVTRDEAEQSALLRANNNYTIKTNHVVHHAGIGHHVQNFHAAHSPLCDSPLTPTLSSCSQRRFKGS